MMGVRPWYWMKRNRVSPTGVAMSNHLTAPPSTRRSSMPVVGVAWRACRIVKALSTSVTSKTTRPTPSGCCSSH